VNKYLVAAVTAALIAGATIGRAPASAQAPAASGGRVDPALIEDLVAGYRILADQGVLDAYGHVSMRHPGNPNRYLMSRSLAPEDVTANDIMEYDIDSNPIDARGRLSVQERFIHGEIYRAHPAVKSVVHSHSPAVVPFSVTKVPLRPVYHMASFLWVGVPVWDIRSVKDPTAASLLVRNIPVGKSLAAALGDKPVALLRGHGNVVVGPDILTAVRYAIWTEKNAAMQTAAMQLGGPITFITAEEGDARDKNPGDPNRGWEAWKKHAMAK
jgi:HCOMODA/2-hydroxy-3-carboxy-muconic semialdehyde decarboxylase